MSEEVIGFGVYSVSEEAKASGVLGILRVGDTQYALSEEDVKALAGALTNLLPADD